MTKMANPPGCRGGPANPPTLSLNFLENGSNDFFETWHDRGPHQVDSNDTSFVKIENPWVQLFPIRQLETGKSAEKGVPTTRVKYSKWFHVPERYVRL